MKKLISLMLIAMAANQAADVRAQSTPVIAVPVSKGS